MAEPANCIMQSIISFANGIIYDYDTSPKKVSIIWYVAYIKDKRKNARSN